MDKKDIKTPQFYTDRYIISSCMSDAEARFVKGNPETANWKKATPCRICLQSENWRNMEVKDNFGNKIGIKGVKLKRAQDPDKTQYIQITYGKDENFAFTSHKETIERFYCGLCLILQQRKEIESDKFYAKTIEQFKKMIKNQEQFFAFEDFKPAPPVPPPPATMPTE